MLVVDHHPPAQTYYQYNDNKHGAEKYVEPVVVLSARSVHVEVPVALGRVVYPAPIVFSNEPAVDTNNHE